MKKTDFQRYAADPIAFFADRFIPTADGPKRLGDTWFDFQRDWLAALAAALLAVATGKRADCRKFYFEGPKGVAKSTMIALSVLWLAIFSRSALLVQILAADKEQAAEWWKAAQELLRLNPELASYVNQQAMKIIGDNTGTVAETLAADIAGSPGARPHVMFVDEFCQITKQEFLQNCLDNASKLANSIVAIFTNAGWQSTYQFEWRNAWRQSAAWKCFGRYEPSPSIDSTDLQESERRNSPGRHRRLHYTQWSPDSEDGVPEAWLRACEVNEPTPWNLPPGVTAVVGAIDAGLKSDAFGIAICGVEVETRRVRALYTQSWHPIGGMEVDVGEVEKTIFDLAQRFRCFEWLCDPWQAAYLRQRLCNHGLDARDVPATPKNLDLIAQVFWNSFRERLVVIPNTMTELLGDLRKFSIAEKPGPQTTAWRLHASRDQSGHADVGTAFAAALCQCQIYSRSLPRRTGSTSLMDYPNVGSGALVPVDGCGVPLPTAYDPYTTLARQGYDPMSARQIPLPRR